MSLTPNILVVGATGYLGQHILKELLLRGASFKALARNRTKLEMMGLDASQIVEAQVTDSKQLDGHFNGVDVVISCLGITRQRDAVTYMDVDYQANLNVLEAAEKSGVKKFIYISAFGAERHQNVRLLAAKELFARRLLNSNVLEPCVIRPNGFFSDLKEIYNMTAKGKGYLFGQDGVRVNPIHGSDLARFCIEAIDRSELELAVGGPEVLSTREMIELAFNAQNKESKITVLPDLVRKIGLVIAKRLPEKWGGAAEFFLAMMSQDAIAPSYGQQTLGDYYVHCFNEEHSGKQ
ncbi:oxidoreductase [Vibrio maritimus]|uniref:Oxidoreductase n=1 Tax=Vibrio maritimus TaxID=990268 RepID=A0A090SVQ2_9VIBR|nr:oxidoreductase [Vibrio maritimus]